MEKIKENVIEIFTDMINKSWTFNRLTDFEKQQWYKTLNDIRTGKALKGTFNQRWDILQAIYGSFLNGVGYTNFNWREDN